MNLKKWAKIGAGAAVVAGYERWMDARNARRERVPLRDAEGVVIPSERVTYSDGATVSLVDHGEGAPLVLVPGADGVKETFRYQVTEFASRHRVLVADLRETFAPDATFDRLVHDVYELMRSREAGPAVLLGQSLGGAICMRFAVLYPELVRGLVLSNTLPRVSYEHVGLNRSILAPVANLSVRYLPEPLARMAAMGWSEVSAWVFDDSPGGGKVVDYVMDWGPRTVSRRVAGRRVDLFREVDLGPQLSRIRAPTLVLRGPRDAYCAPAWSREIASAIPYARYVEIPDTGHCSHVSMPGRFNAVVSDWVAGLGTSDAATAGAEGAAGTDAGTEAAGAKAPGAEATGPEADGPPDTRGEEG